MRPLSRAGKERMRADDVDEPSSDLTVDMLAALPPEERASTRAPRTRSSPTTASWPLMAAWGRGRCRKISVGVKDYEQKAHTIYV